MATRFRLRKHYFFTSHMGSHARRFALELLTDAANLWGPTRCTIAKRTFLVIANNLFTRKSPHLVMGTLPCNYSYLFATERGTRFEIFVLKPTRKKLTLICDVFVLNYPTFLDIMLHSLCNEVLCVLIFYVLIKLSQTL